MKGALCNVQVSLLGRDKRAFHVLCGYAVCTGVCVHTCVSRVGSLSDRRYLLCCGNSSGTVLFTYTCCTMLLMCLIIYTCMCSHPCFYYYYFLAKGLVSVCVHRGMLLCILNCECLVFCLTPTTPHPTTQHAI